MTRGCMGLEQLQAHQGRLHHMPCSNPQLIWQRSTVQQRGTGIGTCAMHCPGRSALPLSTSTSSGGGRGGSVRAAAEPPDGAGDFWAGMPKYTVHMEKRDFPLDTWLQRFTKGSLNLEPEYQRPFVWDQKMASKLVAHAISRLTVQPVLLHEQKGGRYDVVDGKQRMVVLLSFLMGGNASFPEAPWLREFRLQIEDDDALQPFLDGKRFSDLPVGLQDELLNFNLSAMIMKETSDLDAVYRQYEGINQGSKKHSRHQLRKVAYRGDYIRLIDGLGRGSRVRADDTTAGVWQKLQPQLGSRFCELIGFTPLDRDEEEDLELVLRFFAMKRSYKSFKAPIKDFLNRELQEESGGGARQRRELAPRELEAMAREFGGAVELAHAALRLHTRDAAFAPILPDPKKKPSKLLSVPAVYDTFMPGLCEALEDHGWKVTVFKQHAAAILEGMEALLSDARWKACCKTTSAANLKERASMFREMMRRAVPSAAAAGAGSPRSFSKRDKRRLVSEAMAGSGGEEEAASDEEEAGGGGDGDGGREGGAAAAPAASAVTGPRGLSAGIGSLCPSDPVAAAAPGSSTPASPAPSPRLGAAGAAGAPAPGPRRGAGVQCLWCGEAIVHESHAQVDHVTPWARGGATSLDNAALLHERCNKQKGARRALWQGPYATWLREEGLPLPPKLQRPADSRT